MMMMVMCRWGGVGWGGGERKRGREKEREVGGGEEDV